jgi:F-type H+-transporting ATPase subunit epsilon
MSDKTASTSTDASLFRCLVVTPEATVLDTSARFVALPLYDGEMGIAPKHSPLIGRLGSGEMRVVEPTTTFVYFIEGGFVQVAGGCVSVLTNRATPAERIDMEVAREQLVGARTVTAHGDKPIARRAVQVDVARARLRVARRAATRG